MTREAYSTKIDKVNREMLQKLSEITRIPQSKLMDEALEMLFKKYGKVLKNVSL